MISVLLIVGYVAAGVYLVDPTLSTETLLGGLAVVVVGLLGVFGFHRR